MFRCSACLDGGRVGPDRQEINAAKSSVFSPVWVVPRAVNNYMSTRPKSPRKQQSSRSWWSSRGSASMMTGDYVLIFYMKSQFAGLLLGGAVLCCGVVPCWADCQSSSRWGNECPPWSACSVRVGECGSSGMLAVCSGRCAPGLVNRFVLKSGGVLVSVMDPTLDGTVGLEWVPAVLDGHLSVRGEWWTSNVWRFGPAFTVPLFEWLLVAATADGGHAEGRWAVGGGVGVELFPWSFLPELGFISLLLEGGVLLFPSHDSTTMEHLSMALRVWL